MVQLPERIYLAGPMTGRPEFNYPAFHNAAAILRARGFKVANPAENQPPSPSPTWDDWMRASLAQLAGCDAVALLPGWSMSRGAGREFVEATRAGKRVMPLAQWVAMNPGGHA